MYSALFPHKVKNLITTVTPSNFDTDKGLLHIWMKEVDADRMVDTYGNIPGDLLNIGFLLLNPARLMIDKYVGFLENIDNKNFVENFIRMEKWIFDSPDLPGETFRQFVKDCYQKNLLIQSKMELGGRRVDLNRVTMPVMNIYGRYDHLVPPEACNLLTSRVGSTDTEDICLDTGHIGIYVSSKCQKELSPKIVQWLQDREAEKTGEREDESTTKVSVDTAPAARTPAKRPAKKPARKARAAPASTTEAPATNETKAAATTKRRRKNKTTGEKEA
jgi:polyhydroxyalkanoate synthase